MRLHELEENKIYIGEDGREYAIQEEMLHYRNKECDTWKRAAFISQFTQNFTPKKAKKEEPVVQWYSVLAKMKGEPRPYPYYDPYKGEDEFLMAVGLAKDRFDWIKLTPVCKTQGDKLVEE